MYNTKFLIYLFLGMMLTSCSHPQEEISENVLVEYGELKLTKEDVEARIPQGLNAQDSVALYKAIVEDWLKEEVLSDFAEERLFDTGSIDQKVRDYRNSLIVQEYISRMQEFQTPKIDEDKIKEYYALHKNEMKLEVPLVKGVFLKISRGSDPQEEIKRLLTSKDPASIDVLEQTWMDRALEYNYFRDKWIDWETLAGMIPYRFADPDEFLSQHSFFETEYGDCSYYLQISDYIKTGEIQPYEYSKHWIGNLLTQSSLAEYERVLVNSLIKKALKDGKLKLVGYDAGMK